MYVLEVLPLTPGAPAGTLSYRSAKDVGAGSIVEVTLRRRRVPGVVVAARHALEAKAELKAASYMVSGSVSAPVGKIPDALWEAVGRIAEWHAASPGAVLATLLQENLANAGAAGDGKGIAFPTASSTGFSITPVELPLDGRADAYREIVARESEARRATLLVVSTLAEVEYWKRTLGDCDPVVLTGSLTPKRREAALRKALESESLIIATPISSFAELPTLGTVIVERVGAGGFRMLKRPYLDMRVALQEYARSASLPLVYGDFPLPLEYRADIRALPETTPAFTVLDTRKDPLLAEEQTPWSAVPEALRARIGSALAAGGRVAVLAVRKGYAPVVVCRDCGQALRDERGSLYAFTQERGERKFRTSDGTRVIGTEMSCPNCDSWNLLPLGVGVERVAEELRAAFPKAPLALFDADTVRTAAGARKRLAVLGSPGSIIVGTEAMVPWLLAKTSVPLSLAAIASADTLLALPFWRARERMVRLAYLLAAAAPERMLCTRLPDDSTIALLRDPASTAFFSEETALRSALGYPPHGTLIALQFVGSVAILDRIEKDICERLGSLAMPSVSEVAVEGKELQIRVIPDRLVQGAQHRRTLVLMLPKDAWPDTALSRALAALPPSVRTIIDPESFW